MLRIASRRTGAALCLVVVSATSFAVAGGVPSPAPGIAYPRLPSSLQTRQILDAVLDTVFSVGSVNDTILLNPIRIAASTTQIFTFDAGNQAIKAFTTAGELAWTLGAQGAGPGEFRKVRAISVGIDGGPVVVDQTNARLSIVSRDGVLLKEISLRSLDGSPEQVLQLAPDTFLVWTLTPNNTPLTLIDGTGAVLERRPPPFRIAAKVPFLGAQAKLSNGIGHPRTWVYGFQFVDNWRVLEGLTPVSEEYSYAEEVPLPEVEFENRGRGEMSATMGNVVRAALSVSVLGDTVFVLFAGRTAERGRLIDLFRMSDGRYVGTVLLPSAAYEMAVTPGHFVLLIRDPYPQIILLQYNLPGRSQ